MINLIPPKEKEKVLMEKMNKVVIIHWFLIFFFILCFILVLFSIRTYFKSRALAEDSIVSNTKNSRDIERVALFKEEMSVVNKKLGDQNSFIKNKIYFSDILEKIAQTLPENIKLKSISTTLDENKVIEVFISGFAEQRECLVDFKENLEKEKAISDISFPPSNWIKASDIDFSVSFNIKP